MSRILGIDFGEKRFGFSISDELSITAQPLEVYLRKGIKRDKEKIKTIIEQYEIEKIVIGLPKNMNGKLGTQAEKVLDFVKVIESNLKLPVITWDERLTTKIAEQVLISGNVRREKRKNVIDKMAAQLILQSYLDSYLKPITKNLF